MAKVKSKYVCQNCGYENPKWLGKCPECLQWNTFVEEIEEKMTPKQQSLARQASRSTSRPVKINSIAPKREERFSTSIPELDRVLGGGVIPGSLVLVGGDPGIGKSTLLLQVSNNVAETGKKVLYISGEESESQIKMRAKRLKVSSDNLYIYTENNLAAIELQIAEVEPDMVIVDSIQTMISPEINSAPGTISQIKEGTSKFMKISKSKSISTFIVGHVTKEGALAGPKLLEHMVDTVLYFEGERNTELRILYGQKNRFGSTNEIAVFRMEAEGLEEVKNPSEFLLSGRALFSPGSVVSSAMEGTRPLLMEIQGLLVPTSFGIPRRTANGMDYNRLNMLLAVMERSLGISCSKYDAYINITGGMRISEPAIDLAIILSLLSSYRNLPVSEDIMVFGEVGLSGEVRAVRQGKQRIEEAKRLGFHHIILPAYHLPKERYDSSGIHLIPVKNIREALTIFKS